MSRKSTELTTNQQCLSRENIAVNQKASMGCEILFEGNHPSDYLRGARAIERRMVR